MAEKPNTLVTVKLSKVSEDVMRRRLKALGLDTRGDVKVLVYRLVKDVQEKIAKGEISKGNAAQCDVCGGFSDLRNPECPYCGTIDDESSAENLKSEDSPVERKSSGDKTSKSKTKGKKKRSDAVSAKVPKATKVESNKTTKKPKLTVVKAEVVTDISDKKHSEEDLNAAVTRIENAKAKAGEGLYEYGKELAHIHDLELWKLRSTTQYKSFEAFCQAEVKVSRQHAYRLMAVATKYTEEQFTKYGISKCTIALTVPEEAREKLLGDGSKSKSEISKRAKDLVNDEERARKTPPPSDDENRVTVAVTPGIVEMPMQKRPSQDDWPVGKLTEPATAIQDDPWCRMGLTNDVFLSFRLTRNAEGHFIAIIEFRRGEETA